MARRISKRVAGEIRDGFGFAEWLYVNRPQIDAVKSLIGLSATDKSGPFVRAARRRYARLVLGGATGD